MGSNHAINILLPLRNSSKACTRTRSKLMAAGVDVKFEVKSVPASESSPVIPVSFLYVSIAGLNILSCSEVGGSVVELPLRLDIIMAVRGKEAVNCVESY